MTTFHYLAPDHVGHRLAVDADAVDHAVFDAVTKTPTPTLDVAATWLSKAANHSVLWIVIAAGVAAVGGPRGKAGALRGVTAVGASSIVANLIAKPLFARHRPTRTQIIAGRSGPMPISSSFPSGHAASAFAFAAGVTADVPPLALPLYALAAGVGYSRVHTGVHYPSDVIVGGVLGLALGTVIRTL